MENYLLDPYSMARHIHLTAAGLSFFGFLLRGYWMLTNNRLLKAKPAKILPHIVDTILLTAAIYLVVILQAYPFTINWITAKVFLLVAYIAIGTIALKRGKTKKIRLTAFIISILFFLAIFAIASIKPSLTF